MMCNISKYFYLLLIFIFISPSTTHNIAFSDEVISLSTEELIEVHKDTVKRINGYYKKNDYKWKIPVIENPKLIYSEEGHVKKVKLANFTIDKYCLSINSETGKIIFFIDWALNNKLKGENAPIFDNPKSKYNKDKILKEAENFVNLLIGGLPKNSKFNRIEYDVSSFPLGEGAYMGEWIVLWSRIDEKGNRFPDDWLKVIIYEDYGISIFSNKFTSEYDPPKEIVKKEDAIETAKKYVPKVIKHFVNNEQEKNYVIAEKVNSEIQIVNPNYIAQSNSSLDAFSKVQTKARLAWVVSFWVYLDEPGVKEEVLATDGNLKIWIDAENKEWLGGDVK